MPLLPFSYQQAEEKAEKKLAVLIDADNAQSVNIEALLAEVAKYGVASVKRIYGDWTNTHLRSWKEKLLGHAIQPIQQFQYTYGKNATDSAMIIDAMDLLYSNNLDGFCLVSSDSDFTRLASRIRESGLTVYGFGEKKTPEAFRAVCDRFIYTELLQREVEEDAEETAASGTEPSVRAPAKPKKDFIVDKKTLRILQDAVDAIADDTGWANLGNVGQKINNISSEFDPRNFGFRKLGDLFRALRQFETEERAQQSGSGKTIYIRRK